MGRYPVDEIPPSLCVAADSGLSDEEAWIVDERDFTFLEFCRWRHGPPEKPEPPPNIEVRTGMRAPTDSTGAR